MYIDKVFIAWYRLFYLQYFTFTFLSYNDSHLLLNLPACWKFIINISYMTVLITRWPPQLNMWSSCSRGRAMRLQETQSVRFVWIKKKDFCSVYLMSLFYRRSLKSWRPSTMKSTLTEWLWSPQRWNVKSYKHIKMVTLLVIPFLFQDIIYAGSKLNIRKFPALGMFRWKSFGHKDISRNETSTL